MSKDPKLFSFEGGETVVRGQGNEMGPRLEWSAHVESETRKRGRFYANKWNLGTEDAEDFIQEAVLHIARKCQAGKIQYIAAVEGAVARLAIDKIGRRAGRQVRAISISDLTHDVSDIDKAGAEKVFDRLADIAPLAACVSACLSEGLEVWEIAQAFGWSEEDLRIEYDEQVSRARELLNVSSG